MPPAVTQNQRLSLRVRGNGFMAIVAAVLLLLALSGWWMQRMSEDSAAKQASAARSELLAQQFQAAFHDYLGALSDVSAFVSAGDNSPESFDTFLEASGFFEDNEGYDDLGLAVLVEGQANLEQLVAAEQVYDPTFQVVSLPGAPERDAHMILTRTSAEGVTSGFGGLDLYTAPGIDNDIQAVVMTQQLGASEVDVTDATEQNRPEMVEELTRNGFLDLSMIFVHPVVRDRQTIGVILARGLTGPTLESVIGASPNGSALELERAGSVIASTTTRIPSGATATETSFATGSLYWTVRAYTPVVADHQTSNVVLFIGVVLTLAGLITVRFGTANAATAGELRQSRYEARHDILTGLPNRLAATELLTGQLQDQRSKHTRIAVLYCDLDRLRVVNDSIGHSAGDESLKVIAKLIGESRREGDFVGRFGGDEFVLICTVRGPEEAVALGQRVIELLSKPIVLQNGATPVLTASIGVALDGPESATADDLLRDAELAMYRAKDAGRARVSLFAPELRANAVKRLQIEQDLRVGLTRGEIVVYFQPIVDARTHRIDGFEALVRWNHPERGLLFPGEFLPVAEESGLIVELGSVVLNQAMANVAQWNRETGNEYRIAVNLSNRELASRDVVHMMANALTKHRFRPELLELEISEDLLLTGAQKQLTILRDLRALGVTLSIDDFGTGRASLGQLRSLDMVSTLKIDQSFVRRMHLNDTDRAIIGAVVELARAVGMQTIAEGVEQPEHATVLAELGVDHLQGFAFAQPARPEMIQPLLTSGPLVPFAVS